MKRLILIFLLSSLVSFCQKQGNQWYFGKQSGLNFLSGNPVTIVGGQTGTDIGTGALQEGTSCIADSSGNILFYTGGKTVWNKNHTPMPNGTGLMGGGSSTQSSLIVPIAGNDSIFYVFTSDEFQNYTSPPQRGYGYSVINMCLDNGNGDIISSQKNLLLSDSSTEKLAACEDAAGNGYWVLGHKMFSNEFIAWNVKSSGIATIVKTDIGKIHGWDAFHGSWAVGEAQGQMKFNPAANKLALAIGNADPAIVEIFDFNNSTGTLSNLCHLVIDSVLHKNVYGIEFSPDNSKLYVGVVGGAGGKRIYQYNLTSGGGNCDSIIASKANVFQSNFNSVMLGMQLATDGKIYLIADDYNHISCINYPNLQGALCSFDSSKITVSGINSGMTLPSFIAGFKYKNGLSCIDANSVLEFTQKDISIFPNPSYGVFKIESSKELLYFDIHNSLGELICENTISAKTSKIDLTMHPPGVYFCRLQSKEGERIIKIIKIDQ